MQRQAIQTDLAPGAIGPYSQAIRAGDFVFSSGQIALKPGQSEVYGTIEEQTRQVLENLKSVLAAAGCGLGDVVKTTVFLVDMGDFPAMNAIYSSYFGESKPARSTVEVAALPRDAAIEIDVIAVRGSSQP